MTDFEVSGHKLYLMYGAIHEILELKVFMIFYVENYYSGRDQYATVKFQGYRAKTWQM